MTTEPEDRRVLRAWPWNWLTLTFGALGVLVGVLGVYQQTPLNSSLIAFAVILVLLAQVAFAALLWRGYHSIVDKLDQASDQNAELATSLADAEAALALSKAQSDNVARLFSELHAKERRFHDLATICISSLISQESPSAELYEEISREYHSFLHHICDTAVEIKRKRFGDGPIFASNIKYIFNEDGVACYDVVEQSDVDVGRLDSRTQERPGVNGAHPRVRENMKYFDLITKRIRLYEVSDFELYLAEADRRNSERRPEERFEFPRALEREEYNSCVVYPLRVEKDAILEGIDPNETPIISAEGDRILGFICLDADQPNVFDEYDRIVVGELSNMAAGAMRNFQLAMTIKSLKFA